MRYDAKMCKGVKTLVVVLVTIIYKNISQKSPVFVTETCETGLKHLKEVVQCGKCEV